MKKTLMTIVAIFTCVATISAQENNDRRRERRNDMDLVEIYNRQASRLVKQLKIDDDKEDLFVALYLDYQNTRHNVVNPMGGDQEGNEMRTDFKEISDEQAMEMIQKNFERQEKQLAVDREFLPKFLEILTPQQAAQLFMRPFGRPNNGGRGGDNGPRGGRGGFGGPGGGFGGPGGGFGGPGF